MSTGKITYLLRQAGLMHLADRFKFIYKKIKNASANKAFLKKNPEIKLPPDYLMFESFQLSYKRYFYGGKETANWLKSHLEQYIDLQQKKILDWGCGPARVLRHLPEVINNGCTFFGTDYNQKTINWCAENLDGISFNHNTIDPPTGYLPETFDIIYGISIFTHLSEQNHLHWINELKRILKKEGILMITTQGNVFKEKLTIKEIQSFNKGNLITRGNVVEGHRVYSAFHPPEYMEQLFQHANFKLLNHIEGLKKNYGLEQDTWFLRKN